MSSVQRYARTCRLQGLRGYLAAEQPGYWGLLSSVRLAGLCRELGQTRYSVSGQTDLLHRLGYSYKLTTAVPCLADAAKQTAFLTDTLAPLLAQAEAGEAVVYFADAAHPTHNTRTTHGWTETGKERPLLTVSGRERVNLNAALNAHCPTQGYLDETDCVNVQSTQRLYEQLLAAHPEGPIHVICGNARYYKNKVLTAWLDKNASCRSSGPPIHPI